MAYCKNCGNPIDEESKYCANCGASRESTEQQAPAAEPIYTEPQTPKASSNLNIGMLVWSIINLLACCMPLGIVSLIMTIMAQNANTAEDEAGKLKTAKICNLIGTIGAAVFFILYFILLVAGLATATSVIIEETAILPFM